MTTIRLGFSGRSAPSAQRIAEASDGRIIAVRSNFCDVNWGRRRALDAVNDDISNAVNKRLMRQAFAEAGVPAPRLLTPEEAHDELAADTGITLVGRPDVHTRGRGFWKCETVEDFDRAMRGTRRKKPATHFMEWVDLPNEYRVHIFNGKSIRISRKDFQEDGDYITRKPEGRRRHIRSAAKQAVAAVGLDFGAVDVLADDERAVVLEVNAAPGLGGSMPKLYADTICATLTREETP